jgi:Rieske Fe-S protein
MKNIAILLSTLFAFNLSHASEIDSVHWKGIQWNQDISSIKATLIKSEQSSVYKLEKKFILGSTKFDTSFVTNGSKELINILAVAKFPTKNEARKSFSDLKGLLSKTSHSPSQGFKNENSSIYTNRVYWPKENTFISLTVKSSSKTNKHIIILSFDKSITIDDDVSVNFSKLPKDRALIAEWADMPVLITIRSDGDLEYINNYKKTVYDYNSKKQKPISTLWKQDKGTLYIEGIYHSTTRSHKKHISILSGISPLTGCMVRHYNISDKRASNIKEIENLKKLKTPIQNIYFDRCTGALFDSAGRSIITGTESSNLNIPKHKITSDTVVLSIIGQ